MQYSIASIKRKYRTKPKEEINDSLILLENIILRNIITKKKMKIKNIFL
jgi:hypothetical protein